MTTQTRTSTNETTLAGLWSSLRTSFANYLARRAVYRQTISELGSLSNRELADLGVYRSMIRQIATDASKDVSAR